MLRLLIMLLSLVVTPAYAQTVTSTPSATLAPPTPTIAPTPTPDLFAQYNQDYTYQYNLYQQSYLDYVNKKQVYTKYGTVSTDKDKFDSAKATIINRNNMFRAYLMALRVSLDAAKTANPTDTDKDQIDLSKWEDYFNEQNSVINSINNDSDLNAWATDFQTNYIDIQQSIFTAITQDQVNQRQNSLALVRKFADDIHANPQISSADTQWYSDITVQSDLVNQTFTAALALTQKPQYQTKFTNFFPGVQEQLSKADSYLNQMYGNLKIIIVKNYQP